MFQLNHYLKNKPQGDNWLGFGHSECQTPEYPMKRGNSNLQNFAKDEGLESLGICKFAVQWKLEDSRKKNAPEFSVIGMQETTKQL